MRVLECWLGVCTCRSLLSGGINPALLVRPSHQAKSGPALSASHHVTCHVHHPHLRVPGAKHFHRSRAPRLPLLLLGQKVLGIVGGAATDLAQPVGGPGGVGLVWQGRQARGGLCTAVMV